MFLIGAVRKIKGIGNANRPLSSTEKLDLRCDMKNKKLTVNDLGLLWISARFEKISNQEDEYDLLLKHCEEALTDGMNQYVHARGWGDIVTFEDFKGTDGNVHKIMVWTSWDTTGGRNTCIILYNEYQDGFDPIPIAIPSGLVDREDT